MTRVEWMRECWGMCGPVAELNEGHVSAKKMGTKHALTYECARKKLG